MKIFDISIPITNNTIIYPNNPPVQIKPVEQTGGSTSCISEISFGSHTGTHLDAPAHARAGASPIDSFPIEIFIGPCTVIDLSYIAPGNVVEVSDLQNIDILVGDRILIKTSNSMRGYTTFYNDFVALSGDAAVYLAEKNISLCGIDYLSIEKRGASDNRAHTALLDKGIAILEGIDLSNVSAGSYELYCPPLKCIGIDGAPTRAILITR